MAWTIAVSEEMGPTVVYDILKKHKLLPESVAASAAACNAVGTTGSRLVIKNEDGEQVCDVFVSIVEPDETASLDVIPVAKYFRTGYHEDFRGVMLPVLSQLFGEANVRRISSAVPETRSRTKRALCVLGFSVEGRLRDAIKLHGQPPEDLRVLAILKADFEEGTS